MFHRGRLHTLFGHSKSRPRLETSIYADYNARDPRKGGIDPHGNGRITPAIGRIFVIFAYARYDRFCRIERSAQGTRVGLGTPLVVAGIMKRMRSARNRDKGLSSALEGLEADATLDHYYATEEK